MGYFASTTVPPVPVEPVRDLLDYVAAFAGVAGVLLAAFAVGYSALQSAATKRALVRERRLEFELGLLAELRRQIGVTKFQHVSGYVGALIRDPSDETDLPVLRAAVGTKPGSEGLHHMAEIVGDEMQGSAEVQRRLLARVLGEVDDAIDRRLKQ